jgi:hypothetical protein
VRDGRADVEGLVVAFLRQASKGVAKTAACTHPQLLVVLGLAIHLDLEGVDLEEEGALGVVGALAHRVVGGRRRDRSMQFADEL